MHTPFCPDPTIKTVLFPRNDTRQYTIAVGTTTLANQDFNVNAGNPFVVSTPVPLQVTFFTLVGSGLGVFYSAGVPAGTTRFVASRDIERVTLVRFDSQVANLPATISLWKDTDVSLRECDK